MKQVAVFLALFVYFSLVAANGSGPGNCLLNGTILWSSSVVNPPVASPYSNPAYQCKSGYGRPTGVCNCAHSLNTCNQLLAGCPASQPSSFTSTVPSVIYVGQYYEFITSISSIGAFPPCQSRTLPEGLNITTVVGSDGFSYIAIAGTPQESVPNATYGLAVGPRGVGSIALFFSFEVQSCAEGDVSTPATTAPTVAPTVAATKAPTSAPTSTSTPPVSSTPTSAPSACSTSQQGYMRCATTSQYQTCNVGSWGPSQSCQSGLVCKTSGDYIYCDYPQSK